MAGEVVSQFLFAQPLGPFRGTLFANASTTDLWRWALKTTIYGAIIAIVCCYKGMTASGGAEGVRRAVTEAVHLFAWSISRVEHPVALARPAL
jgi:phospholipid/cholesterol/gamma-HCH transport system permease protein